jgi:hypothetical protein
MSNKKTQRKQRKQRKQRSERKQRTQRQRSQRRRQGGGMAAFSPAPVEYSLASDSPSALSREQGEQFQNMTKAFHGGAVFSGAPLSSVDSATLDPSMSAAAGVTSLTRAFEQIAGMTDDGVVRATMPGQAAQAGGRRKGRKGRKASRKGRKASRKGRKASRKGRKASSKGRKHRKTHRRRQGGGGAFAENAATYVKDANDGMLLSDYKNAGLNSEWPTVISANGGDYMGPRV